MKPARRLELRRERLAELRSGELRALQGGTHVATDCPCLTHGYSCEYCAPPTLPMGSCTSRCVTTVVPTG